MIEFENKLATNESKKIILVDIDGTIADISNRLHFIQKEPKDWASFHANAGNDEPMMEMVHLVKSLMIHFRFIDTRVIFLTGRPESSREITKNWLDNAFMCFIFDDELIMRKNGDFRPDYVIKEEVVDKLIADGNEIVMAIEDRKRVVEMYRSKGIRCLQCEDGEY